MDWIDLLVKILIGVAIIAALAGASIIIGLALYFWFKVPIPGLS